MRKLHNERMFESLRTWATPYGGDVFLYISVLAVASVVGLQLYKQRLSSFTLQRFIRLGALIALPLTIIAMEMGEQHWGIAVVAIVWAVAVAIISKNALALRKDNKK